MSATCLTKAVGCGRIVGDEVVASVSKANGGTGKRGSRTVAAIRCNSDAFTSVKFPFLCFALALFQEIGRFSHSEARIGV